MATLTKTYSGDLSSAIAGQIWEARQDAAAKRREALSEEFIGKEVDDHKLKRGEFFGHALAERATSWLPYMWQHRMPDFRANPDYLMRGQKRTIMSPFASPINPQPTGTRGGPNKPRGGIDPEIVPNDTILGKMINITPRNNTGGIVPKDGMVGRGGPIVKTRKDSIKVKDEKLGKFLTAVFMSLSASILSLNRKLDGNQDALIESKEGMFATQKALEDNSDMLGSKLDSIINNYDFKSKGIEVVQFDEDSKPKVIIDEIGNLNQYLVFGIGNIVGWGDKFVQKMKEFKISD